MLSTATVPTHLPRRALGDGAKVGKDENLEALRGLAALAVLNWHCLLGFYPAASGHWVADGSLKGAPWFAFFNGPAAVTLFFALSGYVLARRYILSGETSLIARGAIKRLPRLMGPVLIVVMASWAMFALDLFAFKEAAAATGSPWLAAYGEGQDPATFVPSFWDALSQGSIRTFLFGEASYNSSIWTMQIEFIGSLAVFAMAVPVRRLLDDSPLAAGLLLVATFATLALVFPLARAFAVGLALATFIPASGIAMSRAMAAIAVIVALYLLGYSGTGVGAFAPVHTLGLSPYETATIGSALLILVATHPERSLLPTSLATTLGRLSFPIYLVQLPVICSIGAQTYLVCAAAAGANVAAAAAMATSIAASILFALPLATFNDWWVQRVNAALLSPRSFAWRATEGKGRINDGVRNG